MKFFVIFLVFVCEVFAVSLTEIRDDFNSANYAKVCNQKVEDFLKTQNNEEQISMFGIACIKMNDLNRLATPIDKLVKSEKSRENAAYFADILFKKKLLFHAMIDGVDISYIRLPKSDYILSFLFDKFVKKEYVEELGTFIFEEPNSDTTYEISPTNGQIPKLVLKIFKNNDLKSQIEYR